MMFCPLQRGLGAPGREPVVTEDEQKKMMAYYYKKQEEFKVCIKLQFIETQVHSNCYLGSKSKEKCASIFLFH